MFFYSRCSKCTVAAARRRHIRLLRPTTPFSVRTALERFLGDTWFILLVQTLNNSLFMTTACPENKFTDLTGNWQTTAVTAKPFARSGVSNQRNSRQQLQELQSFRGIMIIVTIINSLHYILFLCNFMALLKRLICPAIANEPTTDMMFLSSTS